MSKIDDRFYNTPRVINASSQQRSVVDTAGVVYGSEVYLEAGEVVEGLTFRWRLAGTKTGAIDKQKLSLMSSLSGTALIEVEADVGEAADWTAEIIMRISGGATQKLMCLINEDSGDPAFDYAAGTIDMRGGVKLWLLAASQHGSDTVTTEMCIVDSWIK